MKIKESCDVVGFPCQDEAVIYIKDLKPIYGEVKGLNLCKKHFIMGIEKLLDVKVKKQNY